MENFLEKVVDLAVESVSGGGGPFGCVIVKEGKIIAEAGNRVTLSNDPTAHAEVLAIREASRVLGTFDLSDCVLYASCEPCPMCLGAIYWARIPEVYYILSREDARRAGFDDEVIYEELKKDPSDRKIRMIRKNIPGGDAPFRKWNEQEDKIKY